MAPAFRPRLGKPDGTAYTPESTAISDTLTPQFWAALRTVGVDHTNCLDPAYGFLSFVSLMGVTDVTQFVYSHARIASKVHNNDAVFGADEAEDYVTMFLATGSAAWSAACTAGGKALFHAAVIRLVDILVPTVRLGVGNQVEVGSPDSEISPSVQSNCDDEFKKVTGEAVPLSMIASGLVLGKILRQFQTRVLTVIPLSSVFSHDDSSRAESVYVMVSPGEYRKKQKTMRIGDPSSFMKTLSILMQSYFYVGLTQLAPHPEWSGSATTGVVAGKRRQLSNTGKNIYLAFWGTVSVKFANRMDQLINLEASMRKMWIDPFRGKLLFEECVTNSIMQLRGEVHSASVIRPPSGDRDKFSNVVRPGKVNDDKDRLATKLTPLQVAQKAAGFDPDIATCKLTDEQQPRQICKFYNHGKCKFGDSCNKPHVCDVRLPNGKPCMSLEHNRLTHPK